MAATMIGSAFLTATVQTLMEKLASPEFIDYINNTKLNLPLLRQLETTLLTLQVVLDDAEEKQINNHAVKQWLDGLKDAVFDAEDLLDQISYDSLCCKVESMQAGSKTNPVWNFFSTPFVKITYGEINFQMKTLLCETLQPFVQNKDILGLQTKSGGVYRRTPSSSVVNESAMVGRKDDMEKIMNLLLSQRDTADNSIGVVAIWGMGGLGKTTLAQLLYNDKDVRQHFDLKAWVCVSEDFDIMRVTKSLLVSVTSKTWESNDFDLLRVELKKNLRDKRFLFVLDDLWNENYNEWVDLVSPFINGKHGSRVIITTRQQKVAEMARTRTFPIHELEPLSNEECWSLLSKHALGCDTFNDDKYTTLEEIGRKIARKCGGLPIAAKTLGGLLRSKVDTREWTAILNSNVWNLPNDNILPALHLSYQYLPSHLKRCFAYCSIFPKDYPLDRKVLVLLWMAEGCLDYSQGEKVAEELGDDCFTELLSRSLIQRSNDNAHGKIFIMHDLVNDLATYVSGKSCSRCEFSGISKNVRHISYNREMYDISKKFENIYNFKCLRSFLSIGDKYNGLSIKVVDDLIPTLKRLRILTLSGYQNITKLPDSIGNLVQLRYMDLSYTKIKSLPDTTCNLYNLQTLNLVGCSDLTELPVNMGNLINLRHLDISETKITELPMEIAELENLKTLTVFVVGKQQVGLCIKQLRKFQHLQGKLTIKDLHNVIDAKEAHDANLKSKEQIEELKLLWGKQSEDSQRDKVVLDMLQPSINLKKLTIDLYSGTCFPNWLGNSSFSNMVSLCITNCEYCVTLPTLGKLPSLKDLEINGMKILEKIGPEFYHVQVRESSISSFHSFPSLERITFDNMQNWKEWNHFEGTNIAFPRLRTMELRNCPELRGHLPSNLSCIEEIVISGCVSLLAKPSTLRWLSSIKKVKINGLAERTQFSLLESNSPCMMQDVEIEECVALLSMPKLILRSTCLQHLKLKYLSSLTAFPSSGLPTSLKSLDIYECENLTFLPLETWSCYTSLVSLWLWKSCDALTSFPLDGFPALQRLSIHACRSLDSIFILERSSRRPSCLQSLKISSHDLIGLFKVKLKMDTLTALEQLHLECEELSFCEGVCLPPKLQSISLDLRGRTMPPVMEWGIPGLTALSSVTIGGCDDIVNTLMKELLPSISLVDLCFLKLKQMKAFDISGLGHLSSLKNLEFRNCEQLESLSENCLPSSLKTLTLSKCEKLESLPEDSLPDSLVKLCIVFCPLLEERYKKEEHLLKLAHIPVIEIDYIATI